MSVILFAIPFFFLLIALEWWVDKRRGTGHYRLNDAITSLSIGVLSRIMTVIHQFIPFTLYAVFYDNVALFQLPDTIWVWVAAFIAYDFFYYWNHRLGHEVSILWAAHVVHHSSEDYNLTTALRQTSGALFSWIFYLPLAFLGVPPLMLLTIAALNLVYQFWVHTQHIDTLGWMEYVFVTPSNHRVHHAQNILYLDKNYGGVFIVWDRLFGTFTPELKNAKPVYGVRGALKSFNPLWANCQVYAQLWRDSYHTKSWRDKWRVWFGRTGWRPADVQAKFPKKRVHLDEFKKFDPALSAASSFYCLLQHVITVGLALYLLLHLETLLLLPKISLMISVVASSVMTGLILQGGHAVLRLDMFRLMLVPLICYLGEVPADAILALTCAHALSLVALLIVIRKEEALKAAMSEPGKY